MTAWEVTGADLVAALLAAATPRRDAGEAPTPRTDDDDDAAEPECAGETA